MSNENINAEKKSFLSKIDWMKVSMPIVGILVGAVVGSIIIAAQGVNPVEAYYYLIQGAMGSVDNLIGSIVKTIPLAITGLAVVFSYKANIFNVGAEGQLYLGAVAATLVGTSFIGLSSPIHIFLCLALAAIFGGAFAFIPGYLKAYKGFNEIVVTMLLNYIAVLFISLLVHGPMKEKGAFYPRSAMLEQTAQLPKIAGTQLHSGIFVMIAITLIVYFIFKKTTLGYQIKAIGASPRAATYAGMNTKKLLVIVMVISGAIAGIAGAVEIMGVHLRVIENFSVGLGYDAIAVALLANLNPLGAILSAFFFGALRNGANSMQISTGVPTSIIGIIQALTVLFVVASSAIPKLVEKLKRRAKKNAK